MEKNGNEKDGIEIADRLMCLEDNNTKTFQNGNECKHEIEIENASTRQQRAIWNIA